MSAFDVSDAHIRYLLAADHKYTRYGNGADIAEWRSLGAMLRNANTQSTTYRYSADAELVDSFPVTYADLINVQVSPVQTLKAIQCFEYQACEPPDWEQSPAYQWLLRLTSKAIRALDGYEDANWEIPDAPAQPDTVQRII